MRDQILLDMTLTHQTRYRGRELRILEADGFRVIVLDGDQELYSTSPCCGNRDDAIASAKALVDAELDGSRMTVPEKDKTGGVA
jgi:hypothetical protein